MGNNHRAPRVIRPGGVRLARKTWQCRLCRRMIEKGLRYYQDSSLPFVTGERFCLPCVGLPA